MFRFRKDRRQPAARSRKPVRLMLESLEDRLTPSGGNPTVTQSAGGYTALTSAIKADTAANTNYVIQITNSFTFASGGQVSISKLGDGSTLTIEGQNGSNFTLTGNGNRLFTVASGQNVTFLDLTLTGGSVTNSKGNAQGGALLDQGGNVTLLKVIVQDNTVKGGTAEGGGVYASGAGTLAIGDSILSDNSAQGASGANATLAGANGGQGGGASGGGLYVVGTGWTAALIGDTFSDNIALGGKGGNGAAGSNAAGANAQGGNGGWGGLGGFAAGGAAYFSDSSHSTTNLTILDDPAAPTTHPSLFFDNTVQGGVGGNGGAGAASTGTANNSIGGDGGSSGGASDGGLAITDGVPLPPAGAPSIRNGGYSIPYTVNIGNTSFYGNKVSSRNGGEGGASGSGGAGTPGKAGSNGISNAVSAAGLDAGSLGTVTVVNCTVANNTATSGSGVFSIAYGGGIVASGAATLINNTITQNILNGARDAGSGVYGNPSLYNNLIQGNQSIGSSAFDLDNSSGFRGSLNASNNFIASISPAAVSTTTNIVGNGQMQLGNVVGIDASGKPTGGPIYYPLLPGAVSIGAGTTSVLNTIAGVEGTTAANATDAIGNPLSNNGAIDLGAVQIPTPPSSSPSPLSSPTPSATALSPFQLMTAITLDMDALVFQNYPPALSLLNSISEQIVGQPLPSAADLIPTIEADFAALVAILIRDV